MAHVERPYELRHYYESNKPEHDLFLHWTSNVLPIIYPRLESDHAYLTQSFTLFGTWLRNKRRISDWSGRRDRIIFHNVGSSWFIRPEHESHLLSTLDSEGIILFQDWIVTPQPQKSKASRVELRTAHHMLDWWTVPNSDHSKEPDVPDSLDITQMSASLRAYMDPDVEAASYPPFVLLTEAARISHIEIMIEDQLPHIFASLN